MRIATGIITAPGRLNPTIEDTLDSLETAGFKEYEVYEDEELSGCWINWLKALLDLLKFDSDAILLCEDDVNFVPGLREYIDLTLWPEDQEKIALCSLFCPKLYMADSVGWHLENRGWELCMAQAWVIPKPTAERISEYFKNETLKVIGVPAVTTDYIAKYAGAIKARLLTDSRVGLWAKNAGLNVWYHTPSLAQHTAVDDSIIGNSFAMESLRHAVDFDPEATANTLVKRLVAGVID